LRSLILILLLLISIPTNATPQRRFYFSSNVKSILSNFGTYRAWSNGTYARTCDQYRNPVGPYSYSGAVGDGIYRIKPASTTHDVYCLMSYNNIGWTRISAMYSNVRTTPIETSYSSTSNYIATNLVVEFPVDTNYRLSYISFSGLCANPGWPNGYNYGTGPNFTSSMNFSTGLGWGSTSPIADSYKDPSTGKFYMWNTDLINSTDGWQPNGSGVMNHYHSDGSQFSICPASDYLYHYIK